MMEDDIDIEEHDVLDHPHLRNIFPDLSKIKIEIPDDDEEDYQIIENVQDWTDDQPSYDIDSECSTYSNKIILGSKPPEEIKIEAVEESFEETNHDEEVCEVIESDVDQPVLILGSKPSYVCDLNSGAFSFTDTTADVLEESIDDDVNEETPVFYEIKDSVVSLVDWGPKLLNNQCYCKKCQILFPTTNTLQAHNMVAHSFLVALEVNKAVKSTSKSSNVQKTASSGKFCNHCNKYFTDSTTLINHLYDSLIFDKNKGTFKNVKDSAPKIVPASTVKSATRTPVKTPPLKLKQTTPKVKTENVVKEECNDTSVKQFVACPVCSLYCDKYYNLIVHLRARHNIKDTPKDQCKTDFKEKCHFCPSVLSNKLSYNTHIKVMHRDMYNKQIITSTVNNKKIITPIVSNKNIITSTDVTTDRYRCMKCFKVFDNYSKARQHRQLKHEETKSEFIFKKIKTFYRNRKKATSVNIKKATIASKVPSKSNMRRLKESTVNEFVAKAPIPRGVLFKCTECDLHFTTCIAATKHSKNCNETKHSKCIICKKNIDLADRVIHKLQHSVSDCITVFECEDNLYGRILNKCPDCDSCFHEKEFWVHWQSECESGPVKCASCGYNIHNTSIDDHVKWHQKYQFTKKDMIIVEFDKNIGNLMDVTVKGVSRKDATDSVKSPKSNEKKYEMYYCKYCDCYVVKNCPVYILNSHKTGMCRKVTALRRKLCMMCGLTFSSTRHIPMHRQVKFNILDIKFLCMHSGKLIKPPFPQFRKCKKCQTHFCLTSDIKHRCNDLNIKCKECTKKFNELAFKLHNDFHKYAKQFDSAPVAASPEKPKSEPSPKLVPKPRKIPEILKQYNKLSDTWNVLYLCNTCDILCDEYDMAVEHSQKHFSNMESYDMVVEHCKKCDLKFNSLSFERHRELHAQNDDVNSDMFVIITYDYNTLPKPDWFKMFQTVPRHLILQITSRSIYSNFKHLKMTVVQDGPSNRMIHKCGKCNKLVHPFYLTDHIDSVSCTGSFMKIKCSICDILCSTDLARVYHEKQHRHGCDFKVVVFNEEADDNFNSKLRYPEKRAYKKDEPVINRFYVCIVCNATVSSARAATKHLCTRNNNPEKVLRRCELCHLIFSAQSYNKHMRLHKAQEFTWKHVRSIPFSPKTSRKPFEIVGKTLYKCLCGTHFNTPPSDDHFKLCAKGIKFSTANCSKCNKLFCTDQLVTHLCNHHSSGRNPDITIVEVSPPYKTVLYKCLTCDQLFYKRVGAASHKCRFNVEPCSMCGLKFSRKCSHQTRFKNCHYLTKAHYNIIKVKNCEKSLFWCEKCDLYFVTSDELKRHLSVNHEYKKVVNCECCQRKFVSISIKKHMTMHHCPSEVGYSEEFTIFVGDIANGMINIKPFNMKKDYPIKKDNNVIKTESESNERNDTVKLFYCETCQECVLSRSSLVLHFRLKMHKRRKSVCSICGLSFAGKNYLKHFREHHVQMNLSKDDFKITTLRNSLEVDITHDLLGKNQLSRKSKLKKYSNRSAKNGLVADVIQNQISSLKLKQYSTAYERHYKSGLRNSAVVSEAEEVPSKVFKKEDVERDTTSIHNVNNIIFKCGICQVHYFVEKSIVVHFIQSHKNKQVNTDSVSCDVCKMNFSEYSLQRHKEMHHGQTAVTLDDLYVITLNFVDGLLTSDHVYECKKCNIHFGRLNNLMDHMAEKLHTAESDTCGICELKFEKNFLSKHTQVHHNGLKLSKTDIIVLQVDDNESFTVKKRPADVTQEDIEDSVGVKNVNNNSAELSEKPTRATSAIGPLNRNSNATKANSKSPGNLPHIFQCGNCNLCFISASARHRHVLKSKTAQDCSKCGYTFTKISMIKHLKLHHQDIDLKREELIVDTDAKYNCDGTLRKSEKDQCNLNYDDSTELGKKEKFHLDSKLDIEHSSNLPTLPIFSSTILKKKVTASIENAAKFNVYKCSLCSIHFPTHVRLFDHYANKQHFPQDAVTCKLCKLDFTSRNIDEHLYRNHSDSNKLVLYYDLKILDETYIAIPFSIKGDVTTKLYQCHLCYVNFHWYLCLLEHAVRCDGNIDGHKICEVCDLKFLNEVNLKEHKEKLHIKMNVDIKEIDVVNINCKSSDSLDLPMMDEPLSIANQIRTTNKDLYTNEIYQCDVCSICFLTKDGLLWHLKKLMHSAPHLTCTTCNNKFTPKTLPVHVYIHHVKLNFSTLVSIVMRSPVTESSNDSEQSCSKNSKLSYKKDEVTLMNHNQQVEDTNKILNVKDPNKGTNENLDSEVVVIDDASDPESGEEIVDSSGGSAELSIINRTALDNVTKWDNYKIKIFKCAPCDAYFVTQFSINKHLTNHAPINPLDYIECKLCGYQFMIVNTLHYHMTKHHKDSFDYKDVLIEEYNPNTLVGGRPKKELYYGSDKLQSKQISTTS